MERKNRISEMHQQMIMMKNKKEKGQADVKDPLASASATEWTKRVFFNNDKKYYKSDGIKLRIK